MALLCREVNRNDADIGPAVTGKARKAEAIGYETAQQWVDSFGDASDTDRFGRMFFGALEGAEKCSAETSSLWARQGP